MSLEDLPIELKEVSIAAGDVALLDRVTLTIAPGPPTVLIGPNGSGKTTLLRLAMGLIEPTKGIVTWQGEKRWPPARRAMMLQRPTMLRRTATANIEYALTAAGVPPPARDARTRELLMLVGLEHAARRPAPRLSAGEQHRLALARALARAPDVLFLDEPTASLDPGSTRTIEYVIRAVGQRGVKIVMATHDLAEARRMAGEIVLLHRGRIIEKGDASRFFEAPQTEEGRKFVAGELLE